MSDLKKLQRDVKFSQSDFQKRFQANDELRKSKTKAEKRNILPLDEYRQKFIEKDKRFNKIFEEDAEIKRKYAEYNKDEATDESIDTETLPRKIYNNPTEMTEDLGVDMKNLVFDVLKMLANRENPLPFIMSDEKKQFSFAILLCIIGGLMLFFSNLMRE
jgi:hypothetical protein